MRTKPNPRATETLRTGPRLERRQRDGATRLTVLVALGANVVIAGVKIVAGQLTGSPALLLKAAHSVADTVNELFLLASLSRSRRKADTRHPFGYGKERFFWSLLAAVGIFVTGGCFSFYQGVHTLVAQGDPDTNGVLALAVLSLALVFEGSSLCRALLQVRKQAHAHPMRFRVALSGRDDPTLHTVLAEDSTAVLGALIAAGGVALHLCTGTIAFEGIAAQLIALLLAWTAYRLDATRRTC